MQNLLILWRASFETPRHRRIGSATRDSLFSRRGMAFRQH
jgi:hypothetical protein